MKWLIQVYIYDRKKLNYETTLNIRVHVRRGQADGHVLLNAKKQPNSSRHDV